MLGQPCSSLCCRCNQTELLHLPAAARKFSVTSAPTMRRKNGGTYDLICFSIEDKSRLEFSETGPIQYLLLSPKGSTTTNSSP